MYLQANTMADITTADDNTMRLDILHCKQQTDRQSQLIWPNQAKPTVQQKLDWKSAML